MNKNKYVLVVEDCQNCPCATLKFDKGSQEDIMYCQTKRSLIMLREGWGPRSVPCWCPCIETGIEIITNFKPKEKKAND